MPVSSIAKVAIVLCYCSVFEKLIVSSKSLIEVLKKFFECLETRTSILETRYSKLEPRNSSLETRCSILKNFEDRVSSRDCQLKFARYCTVPPKCKLTLDSRENRGSSLDTRLDPRYAILVKNVDAELSRLCRLVAGFEKSIYFLKKEQQGPRMTADLPTILVEQMF